MNFSLADISGPDPQHQEKGVCKRLSQFFITIIAQREYETQRISFGIFREIFLSLGLLATQIQMKTMIVNTPVRFRKVLGPEES